jgi:hypothetical protein
MKKEYAMAPYVQRIVEYGYNSIHMILIPYRTAYYSVGFQAPLVGTV